MLPNFTAIIFNDYSMGMHHDLLDQSPTFRHFQLYNILTIIKSSAVNIKLIAIFHTQSIFLGQIPQSGITRPTRMEVFMILNIATIHSKNVLIFSDTSGSVMDQSASTDHKSLNFEAMSLNGWSVNQQHQHHLGSCQKCRFPNQPQTY